MNARVVLLASLVLGAVTIPAQTPPVAKQIGTVKTISSNKLTIATDPATSGGVQSVDVSVPDGTRVLQLTPGSTDLKTAQTITLGDIEVGDRVLISGHQDAPDAFSASRVILMKSNDIAQKHEAEQADWQRRGAGGLVAAVDATSGTLSITGRGKKIAVQTSSTTAYRRYADGSVKFEDATPGTLAQIQPGDQMRVRGEKSPDGLSIKADEIVSGTFKNLAGTIVSIDAGAETLTLRDLASKKSFQIKVAGNSSVRALPPEDAARFAARARTGHSGASTAADHTATPSSNTATAAGGDAFHGGGNGSAGGDLSQLVNKLPQASFSTLHPGDALMVVASQSQSGNADLTAVTLLSGVEPILSATPKGEASMSLSPWNMGGAEGGAN